MPYRDAVECVLQRCEELCEELRRLGVETAPRPCATLEDALAWEANLREGVQTAEADARELGAFTTAASVGREPTPSLSPQTPGFLAAVALVGVMAVGVCAYLLSRNDPAPTRPARASYLLAANVVSSPHRGDRCTIAVDWKNDACDIDVICPTVERRFHGDPCHRGSAVAAAAPGRFDFDGERGTMSFAVDGEPTFHLELDAWR